MSASVTILGNTGRDVELRYTPQGTPVANFSVASNTFRNTPEGKQKKTDWFNVTAWGKDAENLAKYLPKGSQILIRGDLTMSAWKTQENEPRVNADVNLRGFEFVGNGQTRTAGETAEETIESADDTQSLSSTESAEDMDEKAEMLAAAQEMDSLEESFAGQY